MIQRVLTFDHPKWRAFCPNVSPKKGCRGLNPQGAEGGLNEAGLENLYHGDSLFRATPSCYSPIGVRRKMVIPHGILRPKMAGDHCVGVDSQVVTWLGLMVMVF